MNIYYKVVGRETSMGFVRSSDFTTSH